MHLTCAVAEVLCDGIEVASGLRPGIKWTNDLVSGGRKLCGILTELSLEAESGHVQYAVVGGRRQLRPDSLRFSTGDSGIWQAPCLC